MNDAPDSLVLDLYGAFQDIVVRITQHPRRADVDFQLGGHRHFLRFDNPQPLSALVEIIGDCWNIRVIDLNANDGSQLEFGRYRVEVGDEDGPFAEFMVDQFEHWSDEKDDAMGSSWQA